PLVGVVDGVGLCRVKVDGWDSLSPAQRVYAWVLAMAAAAGRDLYVDQRYEDGLALRGLLEGIVTRPGATDPAALEYIRRFLRLFWIDSGIHNGLTGAKTRPDFTREELTAAARAARA